MGVDAPQATTPRPRRRRLRVGRPWSSPNALLVSLALASVYFLATSLHGPIQVGHCALLTNIFGKKLSEITDIEHRYLLLPLSPGHQRQRQELAPELTSAGGRGKSSAQEGSQREEEEEEEEGEEGGTRNERVASKSRNSRSLAPGASGAAAANTTSTTSHQRRNETPPAQASALVASWRQQQQQQQLLPPRPSSSSARLVASPAQGGAGANSSFVPFYEKDPNTSNRVPPGEPMVVDSLTTDFPNPNINNLGHEITKILRKFFLHGYDKRVRPNYSGPPALVNVSFHIIGISSVDEVQMDFTTDFYFRQKWFDPRLEFDAVGSIDELCVGAEFAERIWLPDTFFANEKTATFHKATTENTFIRIGQNGRVYRSIRLTVTCSCPMDLQYFPMDRQRCKIEIESYGYNTRDIDYRWERGDASVSLNTKIELPQFKILGFKMGQEIQNLSSGDYIRLYCEIHFVRSMGYYLFQIYIPASLIVMISWVSFWLHRNATPARVALGVTTVLTMTTLMSSTNAALPKISYIKSIDVFLGTCFVMVFAALLEYASVGYIGKRIAMKRKRLQDLQQMQAHHQKVCVAAAASAAAAAAAANAANAAQSQQSPNPAKTGDLEHQHNPPSGPSQTLHRRSMGGLMKMINLSSGGSNTLQRASLTSNRGLNDHSGDLGAQFGDGPTNRRAQPMTPLFVGGTTGAPPNDCARAPLLAAGAAMAAAAAAASQHTHGPTTEFEVNQTHDMIRIYGLTPSAIDKHSRVVFPICFVCFNLMYWIIYGHISQQVEDKGPPLIPFIKG